MPYEYLMRNGPVIGYTIEIEDPMLRDVEPGLRLPLERFGATTLALPRSTPPDRIDHLLDIIDGVELCGGADVDPAHYGHDRHPLTKTLRPEQDEFELELVRRRARPRDARPRDLPRHPGAGGRRRRVARAGRRDDPSQRAAPPPAVGRPGARAAGRPLARRRGRGRVGRRALVRRRAGARELVPPPVRERAGEPPARDGARRRRRDRDARAQRRQGVRRRHPVAQRADVARRRALPAPVRGSGRRRPRLRRGGPRRHRFAWHYATNLREQAQTRTNSDTGVRWGQTP